MMFGLFSRVPKPSGDLLTEDQAQTLIRAEIVKRGWRELPGPRYTRRYDNGRHVWSYTGVRGSRPNFRMMSITIDAASGEVLTAGITEPMGEGVR